MHPDTNAPAPGTDADDAALVRAAREDPAAFAALYRRYVTKIYRYLLSRLGTPKGADDAEDLTAQVFTEALDGLDRYTEQGTFAAKLFTIARRRLTDHYRRQRHDLPFDESRDGAGQSATPLSQVVQHEQLRRLGALVEELNEEKQELLRLRFAGDLTYREIGEVVGKSEAATKMMIHRTLRRLQEEWEGQNA